MSAYGRDWYYDDSTGEVTCSKTGDYIDFAEDEAAGRLAAAAPKMARALKAILDDEPGWHKLAEAAFRDATTPPSTD